MSRGPVHIILSLLFLVWLVVAVVLEVVKYALQYLWAAVAWVTTSAMTLSNSAARPLYWKWENINCDELEFPPNFIWGVATAAHQVEGNCDNNNWSQWESTQRPPHKPPTVKGGQKSGAACDHWNRVEQDTQLIKDLGVGSYRFSLEWSKIEPTQGEYNAESIAHYHMELDCLAANGIMPMVTLLHFSWPIWFETLGAFEKEENVEHFVRFSQRMYDEYGSKVKWWCTINEPEVFCANAYVNGLFPPGKQAALQTAGTCVKNMLKSHVTIYFAIKQAAEDAGREVHVGIVKDLFQFHAFQWHNLFDHFLAWAMDQIFNVQIINFLRTGKFRFWVPFAASVSYTDSRAPPANDFIGLNYYSHYYVSLWNIMTEPVLEAKLMALPQEIMTDMPQCVYPEGLYSALKTMATLGKPIIVTENGIADKHDDRRYLYIRRYLYALSRAIQDGVDVIGYYYWSLYDNFEWCEGYHMKFGLYAVNFDTQERSLRPAAAAFTNVVRAYNAGGMRSIARSHRGSETRKSETVSPRRPSVVSDMGDDLSQAMLSPREEHV